MRVNMEILPMDLVDQHLTKEINALKRILANFRANVEINASNGGTFSDVIDSHQGKIIYVLRRYISLVEEEKFRFKIMSNSQENEEMLKYFDILQKEYDMSKMDYSPTISDFEKVKDNLLKELTEMKYISYEGNLIDLRLAINLLGVTSESEEKEIIL